MDSSSSARSTPENGSPAGSSYNVVLDHILQYPANYEIPLRTMYTLNCAATRSQQLPQSLSRSGSPISDRRTPSPQPDHRDSTAHFTSALMSHIAHLPSQPCSLPPNFIISFVRRCFHEDLTLVDFPQGLAALDYLRDLEARRKREAAAALDRLGVGSNAIGAEMDSLAAEFPGVAQWVRNLEEKERKVEALYSQLYICLRRWMLINELSLAPFNKHNCIAMLNTLYPPVVTSSPTTILTPAILKKQRDGFFRYITGVEKHGPSMLKNLMEQGRLEGDENGWGALQQSLDKYLSTAKNIIDDCREITVAEDLEAADEASKRKGRKVDSGVSFGSEKTLASRGSDSSESSRNTPEPRVNYKSLSALEKITREFKRIRLRSRMEVDEINPNAMPRKSMSNDGPYTRSPGRDKPSTPGLTLTEKRPLSKKRSLGSLGRPKHGGASSTTSLVSRQNRDGAPKFDPVEMKKRRMAHQGSCAKGTISTREV